MPKQNFQSLHRTTHIKRFVGLHLGLAKKDSAARTLMEIYGPPGIGKTVLLEQMRDEANRRGWAFANLNSKLTTVKDILNAFIECSSLAPIRPSLSKISNNDSAQPLTEARQKILEHIKKANETERPLIIFCDDMDQVNYQLPGLKSELLEPLILSGDCLVVWAARAKPYWQSVEIALNKLDPGPPLAPFSSDEHAELMQANLPSSVSWPIELEYLSGYPILVARWIELIQAEPSASEAKCNDLLSSALKFSVDHALETTPESWEPYWPALSVIRPISKDILDAGSGTTLSHIEYNSLLIELKKQGLLTSDGQGSFLSTQFALLLQTHFKRMCEETIRQVAQRAYEYHCKLISDHSLDDGNSVEARWPLYVWGILYYSFPAKQNACSALDRACQWLIRAVRNNQIQAFNAITHFDTILKSLDDEDQWRLHQNNLAQLNQFKDIVRKYMEELQGGGA